MEVIKKTIKQVLTTIPVACGDDVVGPCHQIIPDLTAVYYVKINITSEVMDIGFFDSYVEPVIPDPPIPPEPPIETFFFDDEYGNVLTDNDDLGFLYE